LSTLLCGAAAAFAAGGVLFVQPHAGSRPQAPKYGLATEGATSELPGASAEDSTSSAQSLLLGAALGLAFGLAGLATTPAYADVGPEPPSCSSVMVSVDETIRTQGSSPINNKRPGSFNRAGDPNIRMLPRDPKTGAVDEAAAKVCGAYLKWQQEKKDAEFTKWFETGDAKNHPGYKNKSHAHQIIGTGRWLKEIGFFPFDIRKGSNNYTDDGNYKFPAWNGPTLAQQAQIRDAKLEKEAKRRQSPFSYLSYPYPGPVASGKYNPWADGAK